MAVGPDYPGTTDPAWFDGVLAAGGMWPIDLYTAPGRWLDRLPPTGHHPADTNQRMICRLGLSEAHARCWQTLSPLDPEQAQAATGRVDEDATAKAMVAVYDFLNWAHTFNELLQDEGLYTDPSDIEPTLGPFLEGALAARNAMHHGIRRVFGFTEVAHPVYRIEGARFVHTGVYNTTRVSLRWLAAIPGEPLRSKTATQHFMDHLSGRDVRNTISAVGAFFFYSVDGQPFPPEVLYTPTTNPPTIDPDGAALLAAQKVLEEGGWTDLGTS